MTETNEGFRSIFEEDPELITLIGTIVARWAYIDWKMVDVVARAMNGTADQGKAIVYGAGFGRQRQELIAAVVQSHDYNGLEKDKFNRIMTMIGDLLPFRNMIIHAAPIWGGDKMRKIESDFYYINVKPSRKKKIEDWTKYEKAKSVLTRHADDVSKVATEINDLLYGNLRRLIESVPKTIK